MNILPAPICKFSTCSYRDLLIIVSVQESINTLIKDYAVNIFFLCFRTKQFPIQHFFSMVIRSISDLQWLYYIYQNISSSVYNLKYKLWRCCHLLLKRYHNFKLTGVCVLWYFYRTWSTHVRVQELVYKIKRYNLVNLKRSEKRTIQATFLRGVI